MLRRDTLLTWLRFVKTFFARSTYLLQSAILSLVMPLRCRGTHFPSEDQVYTKVMVSEGPYLVSYRLRVDEMKHTTFPQPVRHYLTLNSITLFQMCCLSLLDGTMELSLYT